MRRVLIGGGSVLVALAGVVGLIAFFNGRDEATTASPERDAPGQAAAAGDARPLLASGNVELRYSDPRLEPRLRALAASLGATDTPATRAAGQAVVLRRTPGVQGVQARAARRTLAVAAPDDERLQRFLERSLGAGAGG